MRWIIALIFYCLAPVQAAWSEDVLLRIAKHSIRAELANTPQSREQGLMQRKQLCENCGMLFVFPMSGKYAFWMKDTPLPLSIAFIAADGSILNIAEMEANTVDIHSAQGEILYALEMKKAWFSRNSIKISDRVEGLNKVAQGQ